MKIEEELLVIVDTLIDEKITVEEFREAYEVLFNVERGDDELTDEEVDYFGVIHTKIDFTHRDPDPESIEVGYINYEQFLSWLKKYRKAWQNKGQSYQYYWQYDREM